jgi:hypothetical protein
MNTAVRILMPLMTTIAVLAIVAGIVMPVFVAGPFHPKGMVMILFLGGGCGYFIARSYYRLN